MKKPLEALERERERESSLESTKKGSKIFRCRMRGCMESENFERCITQWGIVERDF
jgi:predicted PP-loop superfamily ATPase